MQKLLTFFFSKSISIFAIFYDQSFKDTLTNDIVSFEQLGPDILVLIIFPSNEYPQNMFLWRIRKLVQ